MSRTLPANTRRYTAALLAYLEDPTRPRLDAARGLGNRTLAAGVRPLELASLHEQTLLTQALPGLPARARNALIRKAGRFFVMAMTPAGSSLPSERQRLAQLSKLIGTLNRRTVELAAANQGLVLEIARRRTSEEALRKSERRYMQLLHESDQMQEKLRLLSCEVLSAQEDERKTISRELHQVIARTLSGINLRIASMKLETEANTRGLDRNIALTQKLVEESVNTVHRFARELRPALLDDLGLIPALQAYLTDFTTRSGVLCKLSACAGIEQLGLDRRTVLFRVAQEALGNIDRHAQASHVDLDIRKTPGGFLMTIHDDGRSFQVDKVGRPRGGKRLGLIGMRERLEMIGGSFAVGSAAGKGTTITAQVPAAKRTRTPARSA